MSTEFVRVVKTTISQYLRGEEINVLKNQKITAMLMQKKRISYGHDGQNLVWDLRAARNSLLPYTDAQTLTYNRLNRWQQATLPWRGYAIPEAVTKKEKLMNRGKEALVNYATKLGEAIRDDLKFYFAAELYLDGTTSANADRIHGFNSCLANNGAAQYPTPNSTYAGLNTNLGDKGGAVLTGSWPTGTFDPLYYYWAPLLISFNNSGWNASTNNWANNCVEVIGTAVTIQQNLKGPGQKIENIVSEASMYRDLKDALRAKERITVERGEKTGLVSLGFTDTVSLDGVECSSDADCGANTANGINWDSLELCSMQDQLFDLDDMEDINTLSQKFVGTFFGNMKMNPRGLVQFTNAG